MCPFKFSWQQNNNDEIKHKHTFVMCKIKLFRTIFPGLLNIHALRSSEIVYLHHRDHHHRCCHHHRRTVYFRTILSFILHLSQHSMDGLKSEPDSDDEVYPISFVEDFEFVDMQEPPTAWKEVKVSCSLQLNQ